MHTFLCEHTVPEGNNGCTGGNMYNSFMYMVFNDGLSKESYYPYKGVVRQDVHLLHLVEDLTPDELTN